MPDESTKDTATITMPKSVITAIILTVLSAVTGAGLQLRNATQPQNAEVLSAYMSSQTQLDKDLSVLTARVLTLVETFQSHIENPNIHFSAIAEMREKLSDIAMRIASLESKRG